MIMIFVIWIGFLTEKCYVVCNGCGVMYAERKNINTETHTVCPDCGSEGIIYDWCEVKCNLQ